ncbi:protein kinase [Streptomyces sp. NPDC001544]|uniref:serine/threonine-protein kinase n=1 Tax=Streptomyces sp. NPDC001544 TaxID=3364584 RepID=UPI0036A96B29
MPVRRWSAGPESPLRGAVLAGRYRVDALLGRGGAADVHEGFDLQLRRPVAVKVFRVGSDTQTEERFADEALLLARLQHPGLVTVHDYGRDRGRPFLVMQLLKGPTLRARTVAGVLPRAEVCAVGAAVAEALAHVHAAGVVHRDVKPSNILMDEAGTPHLTDFGISRLIDATAHTATGALVGTAAYLAPEQVMGREVGPAADVYALGLTLLECLKGRLEYDGAPLEAAIARLHRTPVVPACVDRDLSRLLQAMTALDENERPGAEACAEALAALRPGPGGLGAVLPAGTYRGVRAGTMDVPAFAAGPEPTGTMAAPRQVPAARRRGGRHLATAGAALAALLGVTLTGSIGDLAGSGSTTASGPGGRTPTAPATEPSHTPSAPADRTPPPVPGTPAVQPPTETPGTAPAAPTTVLIAKAGHDRGTVTTTTTVADAREKSGKHKPPPNRKKPRKPKTPGTAKQGKKH